MTPVYYSDKFACIENERYAILIYGNFYGTISSPRYDWITWSVEESLFEAVCMYNTLGLDPHRVTEKKIVPYEQRYLYVR